MLQKRLCLNSFIIISIIIATVVLRAFEAHGTSFWCDESAWIHDGYSVRAFFHHVRSTGPLGPFDPFGIVYLGKWLTSLGMHPHVAFRAFTLLLSFAVCALPLLLFKPRSVEFLVWFVWSATHTTIHSMSVNARPYMSPIFFGTCGLLLAVVMDRKNTTTTPDFSHRLLLGLIFFFGSLSQPYVDFVHGALILTILLHLRQDYGRYYRWLLVMTGGVVITVFWLAVIRAQFAPQGKDWSGVFLAMSSSAWLTWVKEILHVCSGTGVSLFFFVPLWCLGFYSAIKGRSTHLLAYSFAVSILSIAMPPILALKHDYFYVPRQALAILPIVGWFSVLGTKQIAQWISEVAVPRFLKMASIVPCCLFLIGLILAQRHWFTNMPPYPDLPRYRMTQAMEYLKASDKKIVVVLSPCHIPSAVLYSSRSVFNAFFTNLLAGKEPVLDQSAARITAWTRDVSACGGVFKPHADAPALEADMKLHPNRYSVLAFQGLPVPDWMPECRYETNQVCARQGVH